MAKKKKNGKGRPVSPARAQDPDESVGCADENALRPTCSPYGDKFYELRFSTRGPNRGGERAGEDYFTLTVPSSFISKSPSLGRYCSQGPWGVVPRLANVSRHAAHVLVHYLYTDTYQCLKQAGASPQDRAIKEFETSARVFSLAREFELPVLEGLAKHEMERLGDALPLPLVLDLLQGSPSQSWADDTWLSDYLKSRAGSLLEDRKELLECRSASAKFQPPSIGRIILESVVEAILEKRAPVPSQSQPESLGDGSVPECLTASTCLRADAVSGSSGMQGSLGDATADFPEKAHPVRVTKKPNNSLDLPPDERVEKEREDAEDYADF